MKLTYTTPQLEVISFLVGGVYTDSVTGSDLADNDVDASALFSTTGTTGN